MEVLSPPLLDRKVPPPAPPVPRGLWIVLGSLTCLSAVALPLIWFILVRGELSAQRKLLSQLAATMAAPAFARDGRESGLENRYLWALEVRADAMRITPERLESRFAGFGDRVWGDVEDSAYDNALKALAHRHPETALERALAAAHSTHATLRERRDAQMLAGHLLACSFLWDQGGETPAKLYRAARDACDRESEPLAWAEAEAYLGEALRARRNGDEACAHLDAAIAAREKVLGPGDPSLLRWVICRGSASATRREALRFFSRALALSAGGDLTRREIQHLHQECGRILFEAGQLGEAEPFLARAIVNGETTGAAGELELAKALSDLGTLNARLHQPAEAEMLLRRGLALTEKIAGPRSVDVVRPLLGLAEAKIERQDWPEAERSAQRALEVTQASRDVERGYLIARACDILANVMRLSDRPIEAETWYRRELATEEEYYGAESLNTAAVLNNLALNLREQHRMPEAERLLRRSVAIEDKLLPPDNPKRGIGLGNLGLLVAMAGRPEEGEGLLLRALASFAQLPDPVFASHAEYMDYLGDVYMMQGRKEEAAQSYRNALGMIARVQVKHHYTPPQARLIVESYATHLTHMGLDRATATQRSEAMLQQAIEGWQKDEK
ncbi:MAG TPA: tetratricopeptide repeat-containing protein [Chthoniobacteraceae bacterium]|jgi:tetratricopeptide (TPR) repeat protein|nr:tetratricopeptide repeat-containing protein [Chthoniobacteraceae bacterium]